MIAPSIEICCKDEMVWIEEEGALVCIWCETFFYPDLGRIDNSDLNALLVEAQKMFDEDEDGQEPESNE